MSNKKNYHRHFAVPGKPLYLILFVYLVLTLIWPVVGLAAIVCMLGPVIMAVWRGRHWCGHYCPRGNFYDRLLSRYSPHRPIPQFVRRKGFRIFMLFFIFAMFGIQLYFAWGDWGAAGMVFWRIIVMTTVVGIVLAFIYAPRTWCSFCPMGTLSAWVAPKGEKTPSVFQNVGATESCTQRCQICARVCPMQLKPYESKGEPSGYQDPDCIKCGKCVKGCPTKAMEMSHHQ